MQHYRAMRVGVGALPLPSSGPHFEESCHSVLDGQAVLIGSPIWSQAFDDRFRQQEIDCITLFGSRLLSTTELGEKGGVAACQFVHDHGACFRRDGVQSVAHGFVNLPRLFASSTSFKSSTSLSTSGSASIDESMVAACCRAGRGGQVSYLAPCRQ
jgi:hypothetical protein